MSSPQRSRQGRSSGREADTSRSDLRRSASQARTAARSFTRPQRAPGATDVDGGSESPRGEAASSSGGGFRAFFRALTSPNKRRGRSGRDASPSGQSQERPSTAASDQMQRGGATQSCQPVAQPHVQVRTKQLSPQIDRRPAPCTLTPLHRT